MGRWTQYDEDSYRLPEGMTRIGYDADSQRYTFSDSETGQLFMGAPGERYGVMNPVRASIPRRSRSESSKSSQKDEPISTDIETPPQTFHEILPSNLITSLSNIQESEPSSPSHFQQQSPTSVSSNQPVETTHTVPRFVAAAGRATLPKMQGVVHTLRRSLTLASKRVPGVKNEKRDPLRRQSASHTEAGSKPEKRLIRSSTSYH